MDSITAPDADGPNLFHRQSAAEQVASLASATVLDGLSCDWNRVGLSVLDQGDLSLDYTSVDFHLFELCLGGKATVEIDADLESADMRQRDILPGMVSYSRANSRAHVTAVGHNTHLQVYVDDAVFQAAGRDMFRGDPVRHSPRFLQSDYSPDLSQLLWKKLCLTRLSLGDSQLAADTFAMELAAKTLIRSERGRDRLARTDWVLPDRTVLDAVDLMQSDLCAPGGLQRLADLCGMDIFSFSRAFRKTTGATPHQFLIRLRLQAALRLLSRKDMTVSQIALDTGFSSQSHFTAAFGRAVGLPPARFRRRIHGLA
jgi:AraC family transcriptional regulator